MPWLNGLIDFVFGEDQRGRSSTTTTRLCENLDPDAVFTCTKNDEHFPPCSYRDEEIWVQWQTEDSANYNKTTPGW